jgi:hypothetical protein
MIQAIKERVTVQAGGKIEITHPELLAGTEAEVLIMIEQPSTEPPPLVSFVGKGKGCFTSADEVDAFIRAERNAWE